MRPTAEWLNKIYTGILLTPPLQNWRLMEARIDGFCYVWYDGIVDQHVRVKLNGCIFLTTI